MGCYLHDEEVEGCEECGLTRTLEEIDNDKRTSNSKTDKEE